MARRRDSPRVKHSSTCHYCHMRVHGPRTWDHIVPKSAGGPNVSWNRVTACKECNAKKADKRWPDHCERCAFAWHMFGLDYTMEDS